MLKDQMLAVGVAAAVGFGSALAASPVVLNQAVEVVGAGAVADPLIAVEANRAAIVSRLATEFGEAAARAGVNQETLRGVLSSLRADQLLAASLVGTFAELTAIVVHTPSDGATLQRYVALTPVVPQTLSALPFAQAYLTREGDTLTVTRVKDLRLGEASVVGYFVGTSGVTLGAGPITPKDGPGSGPNSWIGYVAGGNVASGSGSAVAAGTFNAATGPGAFVGAGTSNVASGISSLVIGGFDNRATAIDSLVASGAGGRATGARSVVVGGGYNLASGQWSFIGGGGRDGVASTPAGTNALDNIASGNFSVVTGGQGNRATGNFATVPGGNANLASGIGSLAAGNRAKTQTAGGSPVIHNGTFAFADGSAFDFNTTAANEFALRATGGVRFVTAIDGAGAATKTTTMDTTGTLNVPGNLNLLQTTSASVGSITMSGNRLLHSSGSFNLFVGLGAGNYTLSGFSNTATGQDALQFVTTGFENTATGSSALTFNTSGYWNTATGSGALGLNTIGYKNSAHGLNALLNNTGGTDNTASGFNAMYWNGMGANNTANGSEALINNTVGLDNTASGFKALFSNTGGAFNTAIGSSSLQNSTGTFNTAIGYFAGTHVTTGSYNLYLGSYGNASVPSESQTTRIGNNNQTRFFATGVRGVTTGIADAALVVIDSAGQLGTVNSSRRFKDDIADMDTASSALMKLRPVTFHYKADQNPAGRFLQYGLIAEEVDKIYPGLVAHSADGKIESVLYQFLAPMLLNEYQKQQRVIESQAQRLAAVEQDRAMQSAEIAELRRAVEVLMARTQADAKVAAVR